MFREGEHVLPVKFSEKLRNHKPDNWHFTILSEEGVGIIFAIVETLSSYEIFKRFATPAKAEFTLTEGVRKAEIGDFEESEGERRRRRRSFKRRMGWRRTRGRKRRRSRGGGGGGGAAEEDNDEEEDEGKEGEAEDERAKDEERTRKRRRRKKKTTTRRMRRSEWRRRRGKMRRMMRSTTRRRMMGRTARRRMRRGWKEEVSKVPVVFVFQTLEDGCKQSFWPLISTTNPVLSPTGLNPLYKNVLWSRYHGILVKIQLHPGQIIASLWSMYNRILVKIPRGSRFACPVSLSLPSGIFILSTWETSRTCGPMEPKMRQLVGAGRRSQCGFCSCKSTRFIERFRSDGPPRELFLTCCRSSDLSCRFRTGKYSSLFSSFVYRNNNFYSTFRRVQFKTPEKHRAADTRRRTTDGVRRTPDGGQRTAYGGHQTAYGEQRTAGGQNIFIADSDSTPFETSTASGVKSVLVPANGTRPVLTISVDYPGVAGTGSRFTSIKGNWRIPVQLIGRPVEMLSQWSPLAVHRVELSERRRITVLTYSTAGLLQGPEACFCHRTKRTCIFRTFNPRKTRGILEHLQQHRVIRGSAREATQVFRVAKRGIVRWKTGKTQSFPIPASPSPVDRSTDRLENIDEYLSSSADFFMILSSERYPTFCFHRSMWSKIDVFIYDRIQINRLSVESMESLSCYGIMFGSNYVSHCLCMSIKIVALRGHHASLRRLPAHTKDVTNCDTCCAWRFLPFLILEKLLIQQCNAIIFAHFVFPQQNGLTACYAIYNIVYNAYVRLRIRL
ncbi:unnamed protein product [Nesidiocoris tenuis]|uniref:Uncharacterized protein n=1 Tax=Nesidiocoris tenuis TaxID=355587 RepID=A0A6H5GT42_9HEMI|nr:unnamed protein product [Nesidiocoris tenuis]